MPHAFSRQFGQFFIELRNMGSIQFADEDHKGRLRLSLVGPGDSRNAGVSAPASNLRPATSSFRLIGEWANSLRRGQSGEMRTERRYG